jgi:hypothetical protein
MNSTAWMCNSVNLNENIVDNSTGVSLYYDPEANSREIQTGSNATHTGPPIPTGIVCFYNLQPTPKLLPHLFPMHEREVLQQTLRDASHLNESMINLHFYLDHLPV